MAPSKKELRDWDVLSRLSSRSNDDGKLQSSADVAEAAKEDDVRVRWSIRLNV